MLEVNLFRTSFSRLSYDILLLDMETLIYIFLSSVVLKFLLKQV